MTKQIITELESAGKTKISSVTITQINSDKLTLVKYLHKFSR